MNHMQTAFVLDMTGGRTPIVEHILDAMVTGEPQGVSKA